jgi:3-dehydroquinate synthase
MTQAREPAIDRTMKPANAVRHVVPVALGGRSYDIIIGRGVLQEAGARIRALAPKSRVIIITDDNVAALHLAALQESLDACGLTSDTCILPAGERTKSFQALETVCDAILAARLERSDIIVALGGGVIGDLAGFAAAIVRRGMPFVQIPTTLLAQVDSSVGGKTAINSPRGKNLVGAFHQPALVLADTALLDTLPLREFRAGYAEVVKYGFLGDVAFFNWLEAGNWQKVFAGGQEREEAVRVGCAAKAAIVARDETEQGDRALLNLGHTFGHALEAAVNYDGTRLVHGEAIAIGMRQAFDFSRQQGFCAGQDTMRVTQHLAQVGLPIRLDQIPGGVGNANTLLDAIRQDKKVSRGALTFVLARGIGQSFIARNVEAEAILRFLEQELTSGPDDIAIHDLNSEVP